MFIFKHPNFLSDISGVLKILLKCPHFPLKPPKTVSLVATLSALPGLRMYCFVVFALCWIVHIFISVPTLKSFLRTEIKSPRACHALVLIEDLQMRDFSRSVFPTSTPTPLHLCSECHYQSFIFQNGSFFRSIFSGPLSLFIALLLSV